MFDTYMIEYIFNKLAGMRRCYGSCFDPFYEKNGIEQMNRMEDIESVLRRDRQFIRF